MKAPGPLTFAASALARSTGLEPAVETARFLLLVAPGTRFFSLGSAGGVVGSLFPRHGPARPIDEIDDAQAARIAATQGRKLLSDFWGGYVALIHAGTTGLLLRDPSGALPCLVTRNAGPMLAASHVDLLLATGLVKTSIDWQDLAVHLYSAGLPTPRTVLAGIDELLPGFSLDPYGPADSQRPCWSPWDHVATGVAEEEAGSEERLRRTVFHCARSWASSSAKAVLSVSGGLDSSIVAACLAGPSLPQLHCVTMFGDDAGGDERNYARALCQSLGLPLSECRYRVQDVDIDAPLGGHLARPFGRTQSNAYERAHLDAARQVGADAFLTGNGGDNVFAYSQSAAAIADRFMHEGMGAGLRRTLRDVCRQTGCSVFEAAVSAARTLSMPRSYQWRPSPVFLAPEVLGELESFRLEHPWLVAPPGALPGKAGHIAALLRVQPNLEPGRSQHLPVLNPLVSQPIMEACLAIPSWQWRAGGIDRAIVRAAFRNDLPELIVKRRSKGGPDGFTAQLVGHYRLAMRERLLDGHLAAHGLIDTSAIDRLLCDERPTLGAARTRLLTLLATEAWLGFWTAKLDRGHSARAAGGEALSLSQ